MISAVNVLPDQIAILSFGVFVCKDRYCDNQISSQRSHSELNQVPSVKQSLFVCDLRLVLLMSSGYDEQVLRSNILKYLAPIKVFVVFAGFYGFFVVFSRFSWFFGFSNRRHQKEHITWYQVDTTNTEIPMGSAHLECLFFKQHNSNHLRNEWEVEVNRIIWTWSIHDLFDIARWLKATLCIFTDLAQWDPNYKQCFTNQSLIAKKNPV